MKRILLSITLLLSMPLMHAAAEAVDMAMAITCPICTLMNAENVNRCEACDCDLSPARQQAGILRNVAARQAADRATEALIARLHAEDNAAVHERRALQAAQSAQDSAIAAMVAAEQADFQEAAQLQEAARLGQLKAQQEKAAVLAPSPAVVQPEEDEKEDEKEMAADQTMLALAVTARPQDRPFISHILQKMTKSQDTPQCSVCQETLADCMQVDGNDLCHANDKCRHVMCTDCKQGMLDAAQNPGIEISIVDGHRLERPVIIRAIKCPACNLGEEEENKLPAFLTTITPEQRAHFAQLQAEFNRSSLKHQQPAPAAALKACAICTYENASNAQTCEVCESRF
ncbi:MAG: hypothetical protein NT124_04650 [Candidatus Dependentiae bacterium]|nr:hypothetical protein [Candidatus Dependentiae bacterium]